MATLKYSRQRESIKEFLQTRTDHPTADVVYEADLSQYQSGNCVQESVFAGRSGRDQEAVLLCRCGSFRRMYGTTLPFYVYPLQPDYGSGK